MNSIWLTLLIVVIIFIAIPILVFIYSFIFTCGVINAIEKYFLNKHQKSEK
jgi:membrane protein insertase Oxa1/YidC/SpoIIIJ